MNKHQVIERLLKAVSSKQWNASAVFGGASGMSGPFNVQPSEVNKAIQAWLEADDPTGVREITGTLHIIGGLTDAEYGQIIEALGD